MDLPDYIRQIEELAKAQDESVQLVYRGQNKNPNAREMPWELKPSVFRNQSARDEHELIRALIAWYPDEFRHDKTTMERIARAQHYELPTRLMDVTFNPLAALFFALNGSKHGGEVFAFRVKKDYIHWYDSHKVACLANLAFLKRIDQTALETVVKRFKGYTDQRKRVSEFKELHEKAQRDEPNKPIIRLVHFIQEEMPYFTMRIDPLDLLQTRCVKPTKNTARILVQDGAFLLWGLDERPLNREYDKTDEDERGIAVRKILEIEKDQSFQLLQELDALRVNSGTMYPEVYNAARYLKTKKA